jgi:hypothetical protein
VVLLKLTNAPAATKATRARKAKIAITPQTIALERWVRRQLTKSRQVKNPATPIEIRNGQLKLYWITASMVLLNISDTSSVVALPLIRTVAVEPVLVQYIPFGDDTNLGH